LRPSLLPTYTLDPWFPATISSSSSYNLTADQAQVDRFASLIALKRTQVKTLLATIRVAFVGCHGNPFYRAVTWIPICVRVTWSPVFQHVGGFHGRLPQQQHKNSNNSSICNKNDCIQTLLKSLTPTESTDYSLWRATKKIKQIKKPSPPLRISRGSWVRSNVEQANGFAEHLANIFQPHTSENESDEEEALTQLRRLLSTSKGRQLKKSSTP
jgi:hypothetical protein